VERLQSFGQWPLSLGAFRVVSSAFTQHIVTLSRKKRPMKSDEDILGELLPRIADQFPDVRWKAARLHRQGYDHFAVILDERMVFRIPKGTATPGYFATEIALLKLIGERTTIGLPRLTHVSSDKTIMGYPYLPGDELDAGVIRSLDVDLMDIVSEQLSTFLRDLHQIPDGDIADLGLAVQGKEAELTWMEKGYQKHLRHRLTRRECQIIEDYIGELRSRMSSCPRKVLLHSDLGLDHVILDRTNRRVSVIDFSDASIGDPAFDFCGVCDSPALAQKVVQKYLRGSDCDGLYGRAQFYSKKLGIHLMIDSFDGYPCEFEDGYKRFARSFGPADV